jgi:ABC-type dipeptide/oligopeptide/nickel transport system permease subunit
MIGRRAGAGLLALLAVAALAATGEPARIDLDAVLAGPSPALWLGTDHLGRDLAARLAAGAGPALAAVAAALGGALVLGGLAGAALSLGGGSLRVVVGAAADLALATPTLVTALILAAALGGGPLTVGLALALTGWAPYALTVAALTDRLRAELFWGAARALGVGPVRGFVRHIAPHLAAPVGALAGADAGRAVVLAASLGFLGLGADTGRPDWGAMIHEYRHFLFGHPRLVLAPIAAIALLSLGLHLLLDGPAAATGSR